MDPKHLEELIAIERDYWWHVAKRALVRQILSQHAPPPGRLVEVGVGGGRLLKELSDAGYQVSGLDQLPEAVAHCHAMGLMDVRVHNVEKPWPVEPHSLHVAVVLDVLEHLDHPEQTLSFLAGCLQRDGVIVLTVPAYPMMMGPWDSMLGHRRRYTSAMVRDHAVHAGLKVRWMSHWNAFSLAPAVALRMLERVGQRPHGAEFPKVPPWMNRSLKAAAWVERKVMQRRPVPAGLSLVAVLEAA